MARARKATLPSPLQFFARLKWLDGRPLLGTIEDYRRRIFEDVLFTFREDGSPQYNFALIGRAKKNAKTLDDILAAFYKLLIPESPQGNDALLIASDEDQAGDGLSLAKKLVVKNPELASDLEMLSTEIRRRDGRGTMKIIPSKDVAGAHGKTALYIGIDEIHTMRTWDLLEAVQPDPTRADVLMWITSYDTIWNVPGVPLYDLKQRGMAGDDPRMYFSWYSGDYCSDTAFAELPPEERANPSMRSWPEGGAAYLEQQKRRLPTFKYRRLHLNLPAPASGAFLDPDAVMAAVKSGRHALPPEPGRKYRAFVDMSGGSSDEAVMSIAYKAGGKAIVALVMSQLGAPPFNPRAAVKRFAKTLKEYGLRSVTGDAYAGQTFRADFEEEHITYNVSRYTKSDLYEEFEPRLNAGEVELPDIPKLTEQFLGLMVRGTKVDHRPNDHDDWSNAVAGAVDLVMREQPDAGIFCGPVLFHHADGRRSGGGLGAAPTPPTPPVLSLVEIVAMQDGKSAPEPPPLLPPNSRAPLVKEIESTRSHFAPRF